MKQLLAHTVLPSFSACRRSVFPCVERGRQFSCVMFHQTPVSVTPFRDEQTRKKLSYARGHDKTLPTTFDYQPNIRHRKRHAVVSRDWPVLGKEEGTTKSAESRDRTAVLFGHVPVTSKKSAEFPESYHRTRVDAQSSPCVNRERRSATSCFTERRYGRRPS